MQPSIPMPPITPTDEELRERYYYHAPTDESGRRHSIINAACFELARLVRDTVPAGRECNIAQTKLEEVARWANSGIARALGQKRPATDG